MVSQIEAKKGIQGLVKRFEQKSSAELKTMNEETVKKNFILPLFRYLGWDVDSDDVSAEEKISKKRVDYGFKINGMTKFFLEAKKPSEDVTTDIDHIRQAINYSYWQSVTWAILTNFQDLIVFNAEWKGRNLSENRFITLNFKEFINKFDDLWLLSRESFEKTLIDEKAVSLGKKQKREQISNKILNDMIEWRTVLTKNINKYDHKLDEETLDEAVQRILDRLIFIKSCEDRLIEQNVLLSKAHQYEENWQNAKRGLWDELKIVFREFDQKYNSRLFEPHICESLKIGDDIIFKIINELNGDESGLVKYDFSAIPVDVLGNIYEQYLGHILKKSETTTKVIEKHAHRKEQGIYYTPTYIVDYIVKNTLMEYVKDKTLDEILEVKVLDPACGSGSFVIKAYSTLLELVEKRLQNKETSKHWHTFKNYLGRLTLAQKIAILTQCIHGVDLDKKAVEITQLNLLLKLLESETKETLSNLKEIKKLLPMLNNNIKCGNSLIDDEKIAGDKAFKWENEFKEVMQNGGFDVIIGNPPYFNIKSNSELRNIKDYKILSNGVVNISALFVKKAMDIIEHDCYIGFIIPKSFAYVDSWEPIRNYIYKNMQLEKVADASKAFKDVLLEQVIIIISNQTKNHNTHIISNFGTSEEIIRPIKYDELIKKGTISFSSSSLENKIFDKLNNDSILLGFISKNFRGIGAQKFITKDIMNGERIVSGKEIQRYSVSNYHTYFIKNNSLNEFNKKIKQIKQEKIMVQNIVAHIRDHIKITATYDDKCILDLDTVNNIIIEDKNFLPKYILGLLNSKLISFYTYNFIYSKAIRTMHFDGSYSGKIPIKKIPLAKQKALINIVDKLIDLNSKVVNADNKKTDETNKIQHDIKTYEHELDSKVYEIYCLEKNEINFINKTFE